MVRIPKGQGGLVEVFCRYITRNGKRIYPKNAKFFHFWLKAKK
jgi:hypothetical protein